MARFDWLRLWARFAALVPAAWILCACTARTHHGPPATPVEVLEPASTMLVIEPPPSPPSSYADDDPRALTDFSYALEGHGSWRDDPVYGLVWVPSVTVVGADFVPYATAGHWGLTSDGDWIWISDYPWGWVVFHYGRWVWIDGVRWVWVPGRRYAHAWVVWRVGASDFDYIGWAPMPPAFVWVSGVPVLLRRPPPERFVFCRTRHVFGVHVHRHVIFWGTGIWVNRTHRWHPPPGGHRVGPPVGEARVPPAFVPRARHAPPREAIHAARPGGPPPAQEHKQYRERAHRPAVATPAPPPRVALPQYGAEPPSTRPRDHAPRRVPRVETPPAPPPNPMPRLAPAPRKTPDVRAPVPPSPGASPPKRVQPKLRVPPRKVPPRSEREAAPPERE